MSGRVFGASLKPAWKEEQINEFLDKTRGDITAYIINHDKDIDTETHTHIYLEYTNPRKITTVANLLEVEPNFIEIVRNKKGYLRYLTHKDDTDKYQYEDSEVYTNSDVPYGDQVLGNSMSDRDIAEYLSAGRGFDLLGIVPAGKLRTIQSFLHFENSNAQLAQIRLLNDKMDTLYEAFKTVEDIAIAFTTNLDYSVKDMASGMRAIVDVLRDATKSLTRAKQLQDRKAKRK